MLQVFSAVVRCQDVNDAQKIQDLSAGDLDNALVATRA